MRDTAVDMNAIDADLAFACPRCGKATTERFFGPCQVCSAELREIVTGIADANAVAAEYEPKMNVTPNAVAMKDD